MKREAAPPSWVKRPLSTPGLLLGSLFFAASLAPSLIPRSYAVQGVLSGCSFAAGYGVGVFLRWLWRWLGLRAPVGRAARIAQAVIVTLCLAVVVVFSWRASDWQDSVRLLMGLAPVERTRPLEVGAITGVVFAAWVALGRAFQFVMRLVAARLHRHVPKRVSNLVAAVVAVLLAWSLVEGVLLRGGLRALDASYRQVDELVEAGAERPVDPAWTGGSASLLDWEGLGRAGRDFLASTPTRAEIAEFLGGEATQPVRVYVGLNSAESVEERARLALAELLRTDAFRMSVLVIATPTGTGWIDPAAITALEYLHRGDVATVAMQYSYLASWLSLLVEPGYGAESARALFQEVYGHWTRLPAEARPRLYLHGLSLGAMNSDLSADLWDVIADPFQGALWSGPPFTSPTWRAMVDARTVGSPYWRPTFRDGSVVRFFNQDGPPPQSGEWGPMRIVYLQYASDPVTFFDSRSAWREPPWLREGRGPDVSPLLRWFPVVTLLQLTVDLAQATTTPTGFGHNYAPDDYVDGWLAVSAPEGWAPDALARLARKLSPHDGAAVRARP